MSQDPFSRPAWSWDAVDGTGTPPGPSSLANNPSGVPQSKPVQQDTPRQPPADNEPQPSTTPQNPQRGYLPRTCRICLEVVHPTLEPAPEGLSSRLHPTPKVSYISEDPESGRLIRPCKCRGSQKYVHEGCLQAWRYADATMGRKNMWECPTCRFKYRLERLRFSNLISNTVTEIVLTVFIMLLAVFVFGFIADPIIDLYLDPVTTIATLPAGRRTALVFEEEASSWTEHWLKGLASMGLLGFLKVLFAMPWWHIRQGGAFGGVARGRVAGRNRLENISWAVVVTGVISFLYVVWKWVRAWTRRTLEKAGEHVADVQGDDDNE